MAWQMRAAALTAAALTAAMLTLAAAGCTTGKGSAGVPAADRSPSPGQPAPLTGVRLSALIPTPRRFSLDPSTSSNSGSRNLTSVPGPSASTVGCASWWSGKGYFGPGAIGYAQKNYTGPDQIDLRLEINLYPAGDGTEIFDQSVAIQRRCRHFSYQDADGLRYAVNAVVGPSANIGDRSQEVDAIETSAEGTVWSTQTTFIQVDDALLIATETGPVGVPNRAALPLAAIAAALRSA